MPTIKDVAREAGVSIATVSYVLNNKSAAISKETRQGVWDAVHRIGYRPNVTARNLRSSRSKLIGYAWHEVTPDDMNPVLDRFMYAMARSAEAAGYHILTFTFPEHDPLPVYDELIRTGRVDAFVIGSTTYQDARIEFLLERQFPFVSFGRSNPDWDFIWVDTDGRKGVSEAVTYLAELGHKRIAMCAFPDDSVQGGERLIGYREALDVLDIPVREEYIIRVEQNEASGRAALRQWLVMPKAEQPTAIMCVSDLIAIAVMNEAEKHGLQVGSDLSVVGFDDTPMSQYLRPALTTIRQPIAAIGETLITLLEASIQHEGRIGEVEERHVLMAPDLIERSSAAPPGN